MTQGKSAGRIAWSWAFAAQVLVAGLLATLGGCATSPPGVDPGGNNPGVGDGGTPNCSFGSACDPTNDVTDPFADGGLDDIFNGDSDAGTQTGLELDPMGYVTLPTTMPARSAWISNTGSGTVQRIDLVTGKTVAVYQSADSYEKLNATPGSTSYTPAACGGFSAGFFGSACPSRTAVDLNYDAYVANRGIGPKGSVRAGSVTKFANDMADCIDRDMNGTIDTSTDRNADGEIDKDVDDDTRIDAEESVAQAPPDRATWEFYGAGDECILWTTVLGTNAPVVRSVAVEPVDGHIWAVSYMTQKAWRLNKDTGAVMDAKASGATIDDVGAPGTTPATPYPTGSWGYYGVYGAQAGPPDPMHPKGRIWLLHTNGLGQQNDVLGYIDPATNTHHMAAPFPLGLIGYNLAVGRHPTDPAANPSGVVYLTGIIPPTNGVAMYEVDKAQWSFRALPRVVRRDESLVNTGAVPPGDQVYTDIFARNSATLPVPTPAVGEYPGPFPVPLNSLGACQGNWSSSVSCTAPACTVPMGPPPVSNQTVTKFSATSPINFGPADFLDPDFGVLGPPFVCPRTWTQTYACGAETCSVPLSAPPTYNVGWTYFGTWGSAAAVPATPATGWGANPPVGYVPNVWPTYYCFHNWSKVQTCQAAASCHPWGCVFGYGRYCKVDYTPVCTNTCGQYAKTCTATNTPTCTSTCANYSYTCGVTHHATCTKYPCNVPGAALPVTEGPCVYDGARFQCGTAIVNIPETGPVDHLECNDNAFGFYLGGPWQLAARGIALAPDPSGVGTRVILNVSAECWDGATDLISCAFSNKQSGGVMELDAATLAPIKYTPLPKLDNGINGIGISYSPADEQYWVIMSGGGTPDRAYKFDTTAAVGSEWSDGPILDDPYTYSDFLGYGLEAVSDKGELTVAFEGCKAPAPISTWLNVGMDAEIPAGATIRLSVRTAPTRADLAGAAWSTNPWVLTDPATQLPVNLQAMPSGPVPPARFMELKVELTYGAGGPPKFKDLTVEFTCAESND